MLKRFLFLLFLLISLRGSAQLYDSLHAYLRKPPWIDGGIGTVQSFFYGFKAPIGYVNIGMSFAGRLRFGIGYSKLLTPKYSGRITDDQIPFYEKKILVNSSGIMDTVPSKLHFNYFMYYMQYVFYKTKRWNFSVPLRFGFGQTKYQYDFEGKEVDEQKHFMFIYHPAVAFDYAIFRWLGFYTELGYKFTVIDLKNIKKNFNSPVYSFGFFLYYSRIYKMCFPNSKLGKKL
jgi:hypothetical protein